jgi:hypothetical protein
MAFHNKPNFFIVGAPKCGTSALNHYLSAHPDIFVATKEMHFCGRDLRFGPQLQLYRKYPAEYWAEFDAWDGQARTGESSVWYLFSEQAAAEIKAFNPDARIIIMLREPTEMLYSLYSHFLADGNECLPTFEEALAAEPDRRAGRHHLTRQTYLAQALAYRATACFSEQVRRYFDVFGRERVHVILYDDFSAYTARVYRETLDFLGLAHDGVAPRFEVINGNVNGNCSVRSLAVRAILNDPLVRGGAITLRALLPGRFFKVVKKTGVRLSQFNYIRTPKKRQPMAPELQDLLRREFEPEVGRLSDLLGQDLSHWSKPNRFQQPDDRLRTVRESRPLLNQPEFETT